jgi:phage terminase large subunit-like protein
LAKLDLQTRAALAYNWKFWGRPDQQAPAGDWFVWMILAGRGWGKTRTATENIGRMIRGDTPLTAAPGAPELMTIVADTPFDMRQYSVEGPSGFLNVGPPDHRPQHHSSVRTLEWRNGCKALLFSAEDPETLRGASGSLFWWDELAKSRYARDGWNNMMFGMREGNPRGIVTTTPRPIALLKELIARKSTHKTRGSTWDNRANLSDVFYREVIAPLEGTRLGRQEINAEILDDVQGALWTRDMLDKCHIKTNKIPELVRVVVGVDPSGTKGENKTDSVGIVAAGKGIDGKGYVLMDGTCKLSPDGWGRRVEEIRSRFEAERVVAEKNFGGAMVEHVLKTVNNSMPITLVNASRGKIARAEPVAALYEQNKIHHVGNLGLLEDQMVAFTPDGYVGEESPDRADALVWALTDLFLGPQYGMLRVL